VCVNADSISKSVDISSYFVCASDHGSAILVSLLSDLFIFNVSEATKLRGCVSNLALIDCSAPPSPSVDASRTIEKTSLLRRLKWMTL
jgi:hypothetical protein